MSSSANSTGRGRGLRFYAHWLALVLYLMAIWNLSAIPHLPRPGRHDINDWGAHYVVYAGLGGLAAKTAAITWLLLPGPTGAGVATGFGALYGLSDEIHQKFVPGRRCEACDWSADAAGSASGALFFLAWRRFRKRR